MICKHCRQELSGDVAADGYYHTNGYFACFYNEPDKWNGTMAEPFEFNDYLKELEDELKG